MVTSMYVILADNGTLMSPKLNGYAPADGTIKDPRECVFASRAQAKAFAEFLARKHPGKTYHLMRAESKVQSQEPPVKWEKTP